VVTLSKPTLIEHFVVTFDHSTGLWGIDLGQFGEMTGSGDVYDFETCEWSYVNDTPLDPVATAKRVGFLQDAIAVMNDLTSAN
jgi:hypothetical protein